MSEKKIKRIFAMTLVAGVLLSLPISASAQTKSNVIDGVTVTATCNLRSSYHYIYKSFGTGSARIYYTQNGTEHNINVNGSSQADYWVASKSLKSNQNAYKATTTYNNKVVSAPYQ